MKWVFVLRLRGERGVGRERLRSVHNYSHCSRRIHVWGYSSEMLSLIMTFSTEISKYHLEKKTTPLPGVMKIQGFGSDSSHWPFLCKTLWLRSRATATNPTINALLQKGSSQTLSLANPGWNPPPSLKNGSTLVFTAAAVLRRDQVRKIGCWGTEQNPRSSQTPVFVPARPKQPGSCLHPPCSFSPQCWGKEKQDVRGEASLLPAPSCPCLCVYVCPLQQKRASLFNLEIWDRSSIPLQATANWLFVTHEDFIHSVSRWGQVTEQVKQEDTEAKFLGAAG